MIETWGGGPGRRTYTKYTPSPFSVSLPPGRRCHVTTAPPDGDGFGVAEAVADGEGDADGLGDSDGVGDAEGGADGDGDGLAGVVPPEPVGTCCTVVS
ncbi:MAG TPA: hypothetical protein VIC57_17245, partial [Candidatus Dormibacteraeota bacterium]